MLIILYGVFRLLGLLSFSAMHILLVVSVFSIIMDVIFYRRNPKSDNYKYVIFICNCILYIALVFFTGLNVAFVGALAMAPLYILYSNLRFTIVAAIYIELVNILSALKCYIEGKMPDGTPFDLAAVLMQVSCVFVFCVAICFVTAVIIKHSNEKMNTINAANLKTQQMMEDMLSTADNVRLGVKEGQGIINELDTATENSNSIFARIAEGNTENASSIEVQTEMTMKITELIDRVASDTGEAKITTNIGEIAKTLENDALKAQKLIDKVAESVDSENKTIDSTMDKFNDMEVKINNLGRDMDNILISTMDVVKYNNEVMEHIEQLSAETEEVTAFIEEALELNKKNKEKTDKTYNIMNSLSETVDKLVISGED